MRDIIELKENLLKKGSKFIYYYMKQRGYNLYDTETKNDTYISEYYVSYAGITLKTIYIIFNKKGKCIDIIK